MRYVLIPTLAFAACWMACRQEKGEGAVAILEQVVAATKAVKSVTATFLKTQRCDDIETVRWMGEVRLLRPNRLRLRVKTADPENVRTPPFPLTVAADGQTVWVVQDADRTFAEFPPGNGRDLAQSQVELVDFLIFPDLRLLGVNAKTTTRRLPAQEVGGVEYQVVEVEAKDVMPCTSRLFIGPDLLVHRLSLESDGHVVSFGPAGRTEKDVAMKSETVLENLRVGIPMREDDFAYAPPEGARLVVQENLEDQLIAIGAAVPDCRLRLLGGTETSLLGLLEGRKALLLNFWFYG